MDLLIKKIIEKKNPTVAGLDPKIEYVPKFIVDKCYKEYGANLKGASQAILEFNKGLIDALSEVVPAVKPQSAYYEMYGHYGEEVLFETVKYAKEKGLYVILDGKRNDIGATSEAYANAYLGKTKINDEISDHAFFADSLTVNGYLGTDGIAPFVNTFDSGKTIFVLVKTSNKSSGELQDLELKDGKKIYEKMAELVDMWGKDSIGEYGYSKVGAVVGATYPEQLKSIRESNPNTFFLVPGYGAQGGGADDIKYAFDKDGLGAVINSSRGIMCAYKKGDYKEEDYAKAALNEAIRMRNEISFIR